MDKSLKNIVDGYRKMYEGSVPPLPPRLPIELKSQEDTFCRLLALYSLEVEKRGSVFQQDEGTVKMIESVSRWLFCSEKRGLILMGCLGNGKTIMLKCIHTLFKSRGYYGDAQDIYDYYKQNNGAMRYSDEQLLLIDDLGVEPGKCFLFGEISNPISKRLLHRYARGLTTLIATNLDIEEIGRRYGDRVADRLREMYNVVPCRNESYRYKK